MLDTFNFFRTIKDAGRYQTISNDKLHASALASWMLQAPVRSDDHRRARAFAKNLLLPDVTSADRNALDAHTLQAGLLHFVSAALKHRDPTVQLLGQQRTREQAELVKTLSVSLIDIGEDGYLLGAGEDMHLLDYHITRQARDGERSHRFADPVVADRLQDAAAWAIDMIEPHSTNLVFHSAQMTDLAQMLTSIRPVASDEADAIWAYPSQQIINLAGAAPLAQEHASVIHERVLALHSGHGEIDLVRKCEPDPDAACQPGRRPRPGPGVSL